ncbi:putative major facilitator superfamily transporter [Gordonia effusa NBRC 100432]|uniref:Putative major facilitator superfamily transporter n=1 Tax=Gordonia effusa NBRC 100432 TaxID=1077974 RepID=H0QUM4_9ACTN|nr:hypothetical protein [Gordonia effusa]GAB16525.1 putative major facilitator superfamily transporter [Gordonia effusa NBRC 100432]
MAKQRAATASTPAQTGEGNRWFAVAAMSFAAFTLVFAEFLPTATLTEIANAFAVSEGTAGQAVAVTALAAGFSGLLTPVVVQQVDRRLVMIGLTSPR